MVIFHLPKNSGNSGWDVNGTRFFGSFHWTFSGINGISKKVVPFSPWKLSNQNVFHLQISRLYCFYHQFQTFRGLLRGQASLGSLEWNLWQMERAFPKRIFPISEKFSENFWKWKTPSVYGGGWSRGQTWSPPPPSPYFGWKMKKWQRKKSWQGK